MTFNHLLIFLAPLLFLPESLLSAWVTWKGCRLVDNEYNDGDSFRVQYQGQEYIVRLNFVDTPETGRDNRGADRQVAAQAEHFGVSEEAAMHIGKYAKQATAQMLSKPFTVLTKGADARGNSAIGRIYGFVVTADGNDLGEAGHSGFQPWEWAARQRMSFGRLHHQ